MCRSSLILSDGDKVFLEALGDGNKHKSFQHKDDEVEKLKQNLRDLGYIG